MGRRKKLPSIGKLKTQAAELFQKRRRMESADSDGICTCVTCGEKGHWKEMQGGHFRPRGKSATLLEESNVQIQCGSCNLYGMKFHGAEAKYTTWMIDHYGREHVDWLIEESGKTVKWNRIELEDRIARERELIREQEDRLAGV